MKEEKIYCSDQEALCIAAEINNLRNKMLPTYISKVSDKLRQSKLELTPRLSSSRLNESPNRIIAFESCPATPQKQLLFDWRQALQ